MTRTDAYMRAAADRGLLYDGVVITQVSFAVDDVPRSSLPFTIQCKAFSQKLTYRQYNTKDFIKVYSAPGLQKQDMSNLFTTTTSYFIKTNQLCVFTRCFEVSV